MRKQLTLWMLCSVLLAVTLPVYANDAGYEVAFSPNGGGTELVVSVIQQAKKTIRVAAYSFTSKPIAKALMQAHKRGVDVQVVLDKSNLSAKYTSATFLANVGVPVRIDSRYAIMHNKYIVVDGSTVQTGSFNYSRAAEDKNAENVLVMRDNQKLADAYLKNWQKLWDEADAYRARN
jgi:phosphatidylserine/phosphatidylglycerophosphate/cardiolipin synthase-like enzyme